MLPRLRRLARAAVLRFPFVARLRGGLGIGRLLSRTSPIERIALDDDIVVELDLRVPQFRKWFFFSNDIFSECDIYIISRVLEGNMSVLDIGSNMGIYSLILAKYSKKVFAFEPSPKAHEWFSRNLSLNPRLAPKITLCKVALSNWCGEATFHYVKEEPAGSSLNLSHLVQSEAITVPVKQLSEFASELQADFIKIDIEGGELDALEGGQDLITRDQPVILCELCEQHQQRFNHSLTDLMSFFSELGYEGFAVSNCAKEVSIKPLQVDEFIAQPERIANALFIPHKKIEQVFARLLHKT